MFLASDSIFLGLWRQSLGNVAIPCYENIGAI